MLSEPTELPPLIKEHKTFLLTERSAKITVSNIPSKPNYKLVAYILKTGTYTIASYDLLVKIFFIVINIQQCLQIEALIF